MSAFLMNDSVLCEYKKRFPKFLEDESMKKVIGGVSTIIFEHLLEFADCGIKASELLIDAYDPNPEGVPHNGDPIGRKGPRGDRDPWNDLLFYETLKTHFEGIKESLAYHERTLKGV